MSGVLGVEESGIEKEKETGKDFRGLKDDEDYYY